MCAQNLPLRQKKLFIFDLDGVLYRDNDPVQSAIDTVNKLQAIGKQVAFLTNNSTKSAQDYANKLNKMGLHINADQVFTSSDISARYLAKKYPKGNVFYVGEQGLKTTFERLGFVMLNEQYQTLPDLKILPAEVSADIVIVGMDWSVNYGKLRAAMMLIMKGGHFYATNDDANFPVPGTLWPGAGAFVAFMTRCCGKEPEKVFGKPNIDGIENILTNYNMKKEEAVMIGDRIETDILVGNRAQVTSICVGTGVSTKEDCANASVELKPCYYFDTLDQIFSSNAW